MRPRILDIWGNPPDPALLGMVARHLEEGGLVAMPTETVYGFGCALQAGAIQEVQRLKGRGPEKPFLVLVPGPETVSDLSWTPRARELALAFWPGALTLILRDPKEVFPPGVRSQDGSVALRVSSHSVARGVVETLGEPVVSTSANPPGGLPALTASQAEETAVILGAGDDVWILDGGSLSPSDPSTLVDCTGSEPVVRRPGALSLNHLRRILPDIHGPS